MTLTKDELATMFSALEALAVLQGGAPADISDDLRGKIYDDCSESARYLIKLAEKCARIYEEAAE